MKTLEDIKATAALFNQNDTNREMLAAFKAGDMDMATVIEYLEITQSDDIWENLEEAGVENAGMEFYDPDCES